MAPNASSIPKDGHVHLILLNKGNSSFYLNIPLNHRIFVFETSQVSYISGLVYPWG
jgi:hypothetical protein